MEALKLMMAKHVIYDLNESKNHVKNWTPIVLIVGNIHGKEIEN